MMTLNDEVLRIRNRQRIKPSANDQPAAVWKAQDHYQGKAVDTLTVIFKTSGCWWGKIGGCTMCGFVYDSACTPPEASDLIAQLEKALQRADKLEHFMLKIFTSGSFLDTREVSEEVRGMVLDRLDKDDRIFKVIVESRPEFVTDKDLKDCRQHLQDTEFEVAVGLETSSDSIRSNSINKGFTFKDFTTAADNAKDNGVSMKTYLLLKPPFISEGEGLEDIVRTIDDAASYSQTISINLCNVQRGTYVEYLFQRGQYRPPWLWSIVEILKRAKQTHPDLVITSDPVGAGSKRGPHNCKLCSRDVAQAIRDFSLTQDIRILDTVNCECRQLWEKVIEMDGLTYGAPILD